jgi:hypothetical protein
MKGLLRGFSDARPVPRGREAAQLKCRAVQIAAWLRATWAECNYAQRRMIELNTAVSPLTSPGRGGIDELEALYALPVREPGDRGE